MGTNNYNRFMNDGMTRQRAYIPEVLDNVADAGDGYPGLQRCMTNIVCSTRKGHVLTGCVVSGSGVTAGTVLLNGVVHEMAALADISSVAGDGYVLVVNSSGEYAAVSPAVTMDDYCPIAYNDAAQFYNVGNRYYSTTFYRSFQDTTFINNTLRFKNTADLDVSLVAIGKGSGTYGQIAVAGTSGNTIVLDGNPADTSITVGSDTTVADGQIDTTTLNATTVAATGEISAGSNASVGGALTVTGNLTVSGALTADLNAGTNKITRNGSTTDYIQFTSNSIIVKVGGTTMTVTTAGVAIT